MYVTMYSMHSMYLHLEILIQKNKNVKGKLLNWCFSIHFRPNPPLSLLKSKTKIKSFKELLKEKQKLSKKDYGKNDLFKNFISDRLWIDRSLVGR